MEDAQKTFDFRENQDDRIYTSGGEGWLEDDFYLDEYDIHIGDVSIYNIPSEKLIQLVKVAANHLLLCGHRLEIRETGEQDQREVLVCVDKETSGKE
jgi:hypothetical protein